MRRYFLIFAVPLLLGCSAGIASAVPDDGEDSDLPGEDPPTDARHEDPADAMPETTETEGRDGHEHEIIEEVGEEDAPPCPEGTTRCGEDCVDTSSDRDHCGGCFEPCGEEESCRGGHCVCPPRLTSCSGQCVDTEADHDYCGDCGRSCSEEAVCSHGSCRFECEGELAECETGSCYDLDSSVDHCGGCETPCERGSQMCIDGSCRTYMTPGPDCEHCPCEDCFDAGLHCCVFDEAPPVCVETDWCW